MSQSPSHSIKSSADEQRLSFRWRRRTECQLSRHAGPQPLLVAIALLLLATPQPFGCYGDESGDIRTTTTMASKLGHHRRHSRNFRHGTDEPEVSTADGDERVRNVHRQVADETTTWGTLQRVRSDVSCPVRIQRSSWNATTDGDEATGAAPTSAPPVVGEPNSECRCTSSDEIRCTGGGHHQVPDFDAVDRVFAALYMVKQDVRGLQQTAFGKLKVAKILLNFNPIEGRLSVKALSGPVGDHLRELHLGACSLRMLPDGLLNGLNQLVVLELWANRIQQIQGGFFRAARSLRELILWGNQISEVDENTFAGLWKLRRLDLDRNRISRLDKETFRHMSELQVLYIGDNRIKTIYGDTFSYMRSLKVLRVDGNGLSAVYEKTFQGLHSLLSLSLDHNDLSFIPDEVFSNLRNLTALHLASNHLDHVRPTMFVGLRSLVRLDLSDNRITSLPTGSLRHLNSLRQLYLDGNRLETLRRCTVQRRVRLRSLSLVGNPMKCDDCCTTSWLAELSRSGETAIQGACRVSSPSGDSDRAAGGARLSAESPGGRWAPLIVGYNRLQSCVCYQNTAAECVH